jgi:hypothetical protein
LDNFTSASNAAAIRQELSEIYVAYLQGANAIKFRELEPEKQSEILNQLDTTIENLKNLKEKMNPAHKAGESKSDFANKLKEALGPDKE